MSTCLLPSSTCPRILILQYPAGCHLLQEALQDAPGSPKSLPHPILLSFPDCSRGATNYSGTRGGKAGQTPPIAPALSWDSPSEPRETSEEEQEVKNPGWKDNSIQACVLPLGLRWPLPSTYFYAAGWLQNSNYTKVLSAGSGGEGASQTQVRSSL